MFDSHLNSALFSLENSNYKTLVDFYLQGEMERDGFDITTSLLKLSDQSKFLAKINSKTSGILAGQKEIKYFLQQLQLTSKWYFLDGEKIQKNDLICEIKGPAQTILRVERTLLNFLGRMSGVASLMNKYVKSVPPDILICPTRKTLWGLLDKKACFLGGGGTHRLNLADAVLFKENHLLLFQSSKDLQWEKIQNKCGRFLEIEVENEQEFEKYWKILQKIDIKNKIIMFDNFSVEKIEMITKKYLRKKYNIIFEVSGGINLKNIKDYARLDIDIISVGVITHSADSLDFSLKLFNAAPK